MPRKRKSQSRRKTEERINQINPILKAAKGESYKSISENLSGDYGSVTWHTLYTWTYNLFNKNHFPKNEFGKEDWKFVHDVLRTTERWLEDYKKSLYNRIELIERWEGIKGD